MFVGRRLNRAKSDAAVKKGRVADVIHGNQGGSSGERAPQRLWQPVASQKQVDQRAGALLTPSPESHTHTHTFCLALNLNHETA